MIESFRGELNLDGVRLNSEDEVSYIARLSPVGAAEWAVALPLIGPDREPFSVGQIALFGDRVFVAGGGDLDGPMQRLVYTKSGVLTASQKLGTGDTSPPLLLDAESWVFQEMMPDHSFFVRYRDARGRAWNRQFSSSHNTPLASSGDGRIAAIGEFDENPNITDKRDRVSVLSRDSGKVLFAIPVPFDARVNDIGFDSKQRLWVSGSSHGTFDDFETYDVETGTSVGTQDREYPFILMFDANGRRVGWLWAENRGGYVKGAPVFLSDGRAVLALEPYGVVTLKSSFAGSVTLDPGLSLVEIDLDGKRATRYPVPPHTSCLAPTTDGNLLGCFADYVKEGNISWPSRCELVKWELSTQPEASEAPRMEHR